MIHRFAYPSEDDFRAVLTYDAAGLVPTTPASPCVFT